MDRRRTICREFKDTPVAKLFLAESEWDKLRPRTLINWLKEELLKRNPHKLVAQRQRQIDFLADKLRRVPALGSQLSQLEAIKNDCLMVFCNDNVPKATAALSKLSAIDEELQSSGYKKLAVETTKLLSQMRYAMKETWGNPSCRQVFEKMDSDSDGYITTTELNMVFRQLGMPNFTSEDLAAIFRLANEDAAGPEDSAPSSGDSDKMSWERFERTFDIAAPKGPEEEMSGDDL
jgi:hypothetical protein